MLTSIDDLVRLRLCACEWLAAGLRDDRAEMSALTEGNGFSPDDFHDEQLMLIAEFRGRPIRDVWAELARLIFAAAGLPTAES